MLCNRDSYEYTSELGITSPPWLEHDDQTDWPAVVGFSQFLDSVRRPIELNGRIYTPATWVLEVNTARDASTRRPPSAPRWIVSRNHATKLYTRKSIESLNDRVVT